MFGDLIAAYLFLGGAGGGACVVLGLLGLLADGNDVRRGALTRFAGVRARWYGRFFGTALGAALGALGLGALCLLTDVGRPDRVLLLMLSSPSTYLVIGSWALLACAALALWALLAWRGVLPTCLGVVRVLHALLMLAGFVTALYTGLLLASMSSVPLWNSPWLVVVFVLSALSCGVALVVLSAIAADSFAAFAMSMRRLVRIDGLVIAAEALAVALWLVGVWLPATQAGDGATATDEAALLSVAALVNGSRAPWLWVGLGLVGIVLPFLMELVSFRGRPAGARFGSDSLTASSVAPSAGLALSASICVLVGGACLRYLVIAAAVLPVPISVSLF